MTARLIRVSSRALGPRYFVRVYLYETVAEMRAAAEAFNDSDQADAVAVTQCYVYDDHALPIVRLARPRLGSRIVVHELHHASTAIYGKHIGNADPELHHYNEPLAHLHSDLVHRLVGRLYTLGYY